MSNMKKGKTRTLALWIAAIVASLGLLLYLFSQHVGGVNQVKGRSMEPSLKENMFIYVSKLENDKMNVKQGDIIIYRISENNPADFVSRVVAVGGDTVIIGQGKVTVNGKDFIVSTVPTAVTANFEDGFTKEGVPMTVPSNSIFVLGDNRMRSADSRDFGFIKKERIKGVFQFCYSNCQ